MESRPKGDKIDVLLIEDNLHDAEFAMRVLREEHPHVRILHFQDGRVALEFLFRKGAYAYRTDPHVPKVILLDLKLFALSGLEVLRALKSDVRTRCVPVVVMTSSLEDSDLDQAYESGANSYIVKPVLCEKFSRTISDLGLYWLSLNRLPPSSNHEQPNPDAFANSFP